MTQASLLLPPTVKPSRISASRRLAGESSHPAGPRADLAAREKGYEKKSSREAIKATAERKSRSNTAVPLRIIAEAGNGRGSGLSKASVLPPPSGEGMSATGIPSTSKNVVPSGNDLGNAIAGSMAQVQNLNVKLEDWFRVIAERERVTVPYWD